MKTLSDKSVLITGGGSGIGLAAARLFLAEGARVAIAGRDADKLRRAADSLNGGDRLIQRPTDVTDTEQVRQLVEDVNRRFGRIDVLVNNSSNSRSFVSAAAMSVSISAVLRYGNCLFLFARVSGG